MIPADTANADMARVVAWERQIWPSQLNLPLQDIAQAGAHFYNLTAAAVPLDWNAIRGYVVNGQPVIIPRHDPRRAGRQSDQPAPMGPRTCTT